MVGRVRVGGLRMGWGRFWCGGGEGRRDEE